MSKELDRARNLCARRPIPIAIRELLGPLADAAPEEEKADFDDLYTMVDELLPLPKKGKKNAKDEPKQVRQEPEANQQEEE
jgi:hypothetical protein